ncbi:MAG TPA: N-acetyltransferase [Candidatus Sulfotelmatobacter sp.]|nr:N-acetyltransferase [Candidatus Sulfotelmatobacter sp.]
MEVRFLNPDDADEWLRLRIEALRGDPEAFSASLEEYESLNIEEVQRRLWSSADAFVSGAFDHDALQGVAGFFRDKGLKTRHKGNVWYVYVTPKMRGMGVGRELMNQLLQRAATVAGVEQVLLSVARTQETAIRLYRSLGFEPYGCEPRSLKIEDRFIDEEYMILQLRRYPGVEPTKKAP